MTRVTHLTRVTLVVSLTLLTLVNAVAHVTPMNLLDSYILHEHTTTVTLVTR